MNIVSLYSAGSNAHGQLAHGSEDDAHRFNRCIFHGTHDGPPAGSKILSIASGANHTLLLLRSHEEKTHLWGCGDGRRGQLGVRYLQEHGASSTFRRIHFHQDAPQYSHLNVTSVATAWETSFVVLSGPDNDILLSAGSNDFGDLGVGSLIQGRSEAGVWHLIGFNHLLPKKASGVRVSQLRAGPHSILAKLLYRNKNMREVELVVGWGAARHGQLGFGQTSQKPQAIVDSPRILRLPSPVDALALGNQHSLFLTSGGTVIAYGSNRKGQLAGLEAVKDICAVAATWNGTYLLQKLVGAREKWALLATGSNSNGQLGHDNSSDDGTVPTRLRKINLPSETLDSVSLSIICGSEHVLLVSQSSTQTADGNMDIFAWGWNEHGKLGLGHTRDVHAPTRIWPDGDHRGKVVGAWAGCATSWIAIEESSSSPMDDVEGTQ